MNALTVFLIVVWAISAVMTIILVLMHSGKGTGLSDMLASSMYNTAAASGVVERNLDRLTVISAVIFGLSVLGLMLTLTPGSLGY